MEQCAAWSYLQYLLTLSWRDKFKAFSGRFDRIDKQLRANGKFLLGRVDVLRTTKPNFKSAENGERLVECVVCKQKVVELSSIDATLTDCYCWICEVQSFSVRMECGCRCLRPEQTSLWQCEVHDMDSDWDVALEVCTEGVYCSKCGNEFILCAENGTACLYCWDKLGTSVQACDSCETKWVLNPTLDSAAQYCIYDDGRIDMCDFCMGRVVEG